MKKRTLIINILMLISTALAVPFYYLIVFTATRMYPSTTPNIDSAAADNFALAPIAVGSVYLALLSVATVVANAMLLAKKGVNGLQTILPIISVAIALIVVVFLLLMWR